MFLARNPNQGMAEAANAAQAAEMFHKNGVLQAEKIAAALYSTVHSKLGNIGLGV